MQFAAKNVVLVKTSVKITLRRQILLMRHLVFFTMGHPMLVGHVEVLVAISLSSHEVRRIVSSCISMY